MSGERGGRHSGEKPSVVLSTRYDESTRSADVRHVGGFVSVGRWGAVMF